MMLSNKRALTAAALSMVLAAASFTAAAGPDPRTGLDRNNDGMVSKKEFLDAMAKQYDAAMAKAKAMPAAEKDKLMKGAMLTMDGFEMLWKELRGGQ